MASNVPAILTSRLSKLNPFGKAKGDDDNLGETIDPASNFGGGNTTQPGSLTRRQLRVSQALQSFLVAQRVITEQDLSVDRNQSSTALQELLDKPHVEVPPQTTDRSFPLPDYYISSSHNTYLLAHQLYGGSSASAYETALKTGARCVEIDAWNNENDPDEPKVTHGYTRVSNISFRSVCETIRDVVDHEAAQTLEFKRPAPVLISLENHCNARGQLRLAQIMQEVWQDRLLSEAVRQQGAREQHDGGEHVTLSQLGSKIAVIVEYHLEGASSESSSSDESDDDAARSDRRAYQQKKKDAASAVDARIIIPELARLGVYAQSVKPIDESWLQGDLTHPHHHLVNISESGLMSHIPGSPEKIARHNSQHLMRVFPKGTRISSRNLNPSIYWGVGAQICALNWQTFDASMQLNEALFAGSDGFVLKPAALRIGGSGRLSTGRQKRLRLHVAGATDIPVPDGYEASEMRPYLTCTLIHPANASGDPPKRKTSAYKTKDRHLNLNPMHRHSSSPPTDPLWDEVLEWEYEENELVFLRLIIKSDDKYAANPMFAVAALRPSIAAKGWSFIRMLDLKGRETNATVLVRFESTHASV